MSAAAFRLAGAEVLIPGPGEEGAALEDALSQADCVVMTADIARALPPKRIREVLALLAPLVVVVPDVRGRSFPEDLAARMKGMLGIGG